MNRTMKQRAAHGMTALTVATMTVVGATAMPAFAGSQNTPKITGCPEGFQTLTIAYLVGQSSNYHAPGIIDDPVNGGNGDGVVCGKEIGPERSAHLCGGPCVVPVLYEFGDNNKTPAH
jgi:hypothetical protein